MKISPILPYNITKNNYIDTNNTAYCTSTQANKLERIPTIDAVSFKNYARNAESLRELLAYKIPDMYTGLILINPAFIRNALSQHIFLKPIGDIIRETQKWRNSLYSVERSVFSLIEDAALSKPHLLLTEVIQPLVPAARIALEEEQKTIFEKLTDLSYSMPREKKDKFDILMDTTIAKMEGKPILLEFSRKDFRYKLEQVAKKINARGIDEEIILMRRIIQHASNMPKKDSSLSSEERNVELAKIIRKIQSEFESSTLQSDKELAEIINKAKNQIFKIPAVVLFKRKNFIYDLEQITDTLTDRKLANKMLKTSFMLPTSHESLNAFIIKSAGSTGEKIGYDIFYPSVGTVDHIIPQKNKAKTSHNIYNYGLTSFYMNSERAHRSIAEQFRLYPEAYVGSQMYVDKFIYLYKRGILKEVGLGKDYILNFANKISKLSPPEEPMIFDLSKLR